MKGIQRAEVLDDIQAIHMYAMQLEALARTLMQMPLLPDDGKSCRNDLVHIMKIFQCDLDTIRDLAQGIMFSMEKEARPTRPCAIAN